MRTREVTLRRLKKTNVMLGLYGLGRITVVPHHGQHIGFGFQHAYEINGRPHVYSAFGLKYALENAERLLAEANREQMSHDPSL